jgi:hypothetical protein
MPNSRQYRYLHKGENEWLADAPPTNSSLEDWNEAWEMVRKEAEGHQIEFTEDMFSNSEYSDIPEFINVTLKDEMVLQFKMARGVIRAIESAQSIVFSAGVDCYTDDGWGGIGHEEISITPTGAWVTITAKHSSETVEVDVSEQFNQAIGEA